MDARQLMALANDLRARTVHGTAREVEAERVDPNETHEGDGVKPRKRRAKNDD